MKVIHSSRLIMSVLEESDAEQVLAFILRNKNFLEDWEVQRNPEYYTLEFHRQLLMEEFDHFQRGQMFKVWLRKANDAEGHLIGSVALSNIVKGAFQSCHLGYRLDKEETNKGYMTEAVQSIIDYAFGDLKLHRIEANIMPRNCASLKVVEKLGFYNERTARKYLKINGTWEDHIHMVLLNEDERS
jgi:ribosomal-protein-alanine N-acetyltransferase